MTRRLHRSARRTIVRRPRSPWPGSCWSFFDFRRSPVCGWVAIVSLGIPTAARCGCCDYWSISRRC
jgi:hypothetical protein